MDLDCIELTDIKIVTLEHNASDDEARIETAHPGYLGAQENFYVGNLQDYIWADKNLSQI